MQAYDVIVIGAGPAGMICAGTAASWGVRVLVLEQNPQVGKKLSLTGGGRCNLSNQAGDYHDFIANYGEEAKYLHSAFSRFSVEDSLDFFSSRGLALKTEERGRVFPQSDDAADVVRLLRSYMQENGASLQCSSRVKSIRFHQGSEEGSRPYFELRSAKHSYRASALVLATGGFAQQQGEASLGFEWLSQLGHEVHQSSPDIVPLKVPTKWVQKLAGRSLENFKLRFCSSKGQELLVRPKEGERLLFTHFGLSGPAILNNTSKVKDLLKAGKVQGYLNIFPEYPDPASFDQFLQSKFAAAPNKILQNLIKTILPSGLSALNGAVELLLGPELLQQKVNSVSRSERQKIGSLLQGLPFTVSGTMGYNKAVICDGGLDLKQLNTKNMSSKLYPNLFVVGDLLHIKRPSGGFSLQLCWTSGYLAGVAAAQHVLAPEKAR